jgi:small subunit ribosomal protein S21
MKHLRFIARTILVEKNKLDQALTGLNKVLQSEHIQTTAKRWEKYERPFEKRNRLSFQKCMEIYSNEIDRKVKFIVRKNRENPYPWD